MLFLCKMTFEQRPESCEGTSHVAIWERSLLRIVGMCLVGLRSSKVAV